MMQNKDNGILESIQDELSCPVCLEIMEIPTVIGACMN